jgi:hypothetical protein
MVTALISIVQIVTGLFWSAAYILIIKKGFMDKVYGMPMAALCANIAWEFIFSFVYPLEGIAGIVAITWFALDLFIVLQYLIFGRKEFGNDFTKKFFYPTFLITLILCLSIILATVHEFNDQIGIYAAFSQNLMMSVLFITLLVKRNSTKGQSILIAAFKMIGSLIPAVAVYFYYKSELIAILSVATFIFDFIYLALLYRQYIKEFKKLLH